MICEIFYSHVFIFTAVLKGISTIISPYRKKKLNEDSEIRHPDLHKIHQSTNLDNAKVVKSKQSIIHQNPVKTKARGPMVTNIDENYDINPEAYEHPRRPK